MDRRIKKYLDRRGIENYCYVGLGAEKNNYLSQCEDLVLLGDAPLFLILYGHLFSGRSYRLWVLSKKMKNWLVARIQIPAEFIHIMDRYELFPPKVPRYGLLDSNCFVYAGRTMHEEKNCAYLLEVYAILNGIRHFQNHPLYICGPDVSENKAFIKNTNAVLMGDLGGNWSRFKFGKPTFISLSTYRFEDFSVAAAQAQSAGMPVIVTEWFGLADLNGNEVYKIPPALVLKKSLSRKAIENYLSFKYPSIRSLNRSTQRTGVPKSISSDILRRKILGMEEKDLVCDFAYFSNGLNGNQMNKLICDFFSD